MTYQRHAGYWEDDPLQIDYHRIKSVALVLPSDSGPSRPPQMQTCASASHRYCPGTGEDNPGSSLQGSQGGHSVV